MSTTTDRRRPLIGGAHVDSGLVTLLAQDGVEGLQAQNLGGEWIDVPPADGTLAVNFGRLLEQWTGGPSARHAAPGRVAGRERFSIPFFYEPAVDAEIAPLPLAGRASASNRSCMAISCGMRRRSSSSRRASGTCAQPRRKTA